MVDIHCHCLPGIDDGPSTTDESLQLCRSLSENGIGRVIATPHQLGRYDTSNTAIHIRHLTDDLNHRLKQSGIDLTVYPGADVRVDERIAALLETDQILTLADGGRYLLLELPHTVWIAPNRLLADLALRGITGILSHPERHQSIAHEPGLIEPWLDHGALLQITAASLCGDFGPEAMRLAWHFLENGQAAIVASDAHDTHRRPPRMHRAMQLIQARLGTARATEVCIDNPTRILEGADVLTLAA